MSTNFTYFVLFAFLLISLSRIELLGAATDHVAFQTMMGVPSMTFGYVADPGLGLYQFPLYHSLYDDYYHVDVLVDPDYSVWRQI